MKPEQFIREYESIYGGKNEKYIRKQLKSFKHQWREYPERRLKLIWMAFLIWFCLRQ